jgi:hypothetical protein
MEEKGRLEKAKRQVFQPVACDMRLNALNCPLGRLDAGLRRIVVSILQASLLRVR